MYQGYELGLGVDQIVKLLQHAKIDYTGPGADCTRWQMEGEVAEQIASATTAIMRQATRNR